MAIPNTPFKFCWRSKTSFFIMDIELLKANSEQGDSISQYTLACCYYTGNGLEKNYEKAVALWKSAAEKGHALSYFNLGYCYYYGDGIVQDYEKAVEWLKKGVENNNADAQCLLGICYRDGTGVEQDIIKAAELWGESALQGNKKAYEELQKVIPGL